MMFFFKQKTAYEMRISDWSSDVCSSDLVAEGFDPADPYSRRSAPRSLPSHGLRVGVLKAADREFFGDEDAAALYARAIERVGGTIVEIDFAPFREPAALLYNGPWVAERPADFEEIGVPVETVDTSVATITLGGQDRSEEHTSELPSLMRRSYAVFCLKKKK